MKNTPWVKLLEAAESLAQIQEKCVAAGGTPCLCILAKERLQVEALAYAQSCGYKTPEEAESQRHAVINVLERVLGSGI